MENFIYDRWILLPFLCQSIEKVTLILTDPGRTQIVNYAGWQTRDH